jgi:hypothetical protein
MLEQTDPYSALVVYGTGTWSSSSGSSVEKEASSRAITLVVKPSPSKSTRSICFTTTIYRLLKVGGSKIDDYLAWRIGYQVHAPGLQLIRKAKAGGASCHGFKLVSAPTIHDNAWHQDRHGRQFSSSMELYPCRH